ncbi:MAG: sensor histidine kinase [Thermoproteota archaeon]
MEKTFWVIITAFSITLVIITSFTMYYTSIITQNLEKELLEQKMSTVNSARLHTESFFNKIVTSLELSSKRGFVKNVNYTNLVSEDLKGIPADADVRKRKVAQEVLKAIPSLDTVSFVLPNGDMYMTEPYYSQQKLTQLNWADRDWYRGTVSTLQPYISEVYNATATRQYAVSVNIPVFSDSEEFVGIWRGIINLEDLYKTISIMLQDSEYLIFIDHNGNELPVSLGIEEGSIKNVANLDSVKKVLSGQHGITEETINGKKMLISFSPTNVQPHIWGVLLIEPYDVAVAPLNAIRFQSIGLISIITLTLATSAYFYYRNLRTNVQLSEKLKETDRLKEEFSAMITHELKTPLVPIIGYCRMLKEKMIGNLNSEQSEAIDTIENNAKRLESLISDIMDARKLDLDKMRFNIENVSIDELFDSLNTSYKVLQEKGKKFTTNLSIKGLTIKTDKSRLRQVFDNLISNAIKFTPEQNAEIEVGAQETNDKIRFYVKDNGIGIPKDKQPELFKKFYQIDTSERRKTGGTGLGLAISKGIVEKLNGKIWVESDGKTGTIFYFEFIK